MSSEREVVVLSGARTAIGDYGGALKDLAPTELAGQIIREAVKRAKVEPKSVGTMVLGNVIHTEAKDMYVSRVACIKSFSVFGSLSRVRFCTVARRTSISLAFSPFS